MGICPLKVYTWFDKEGSRSKWNWISITLVPHRITSLDCFDPHLRIGGKSKEIQSPHTRFSFIQQYVTTSVHFTLLLGHFCYVLACLISAFLQTASCCLHCQAFLARKIARNLFNFIFILKTEVLGKPNLAVDPKCLPFITKCSEQTVQPTSVLFLCKCDLQFRRCNSFVFPMTPTS